MKISKQKILREATEIRQFIEMNGKLPTYATIDGSQLTKSQYTYLLVKLTSNINLKNVDKIFVKDPQFPNGKVIGEKVQKDDYLNMANRIVKYIEKNKQVPNYCATTKSKINVSFDLYVYCFAKILDFYNKNNALPNYCMFNSKDIKYTKNNNNSSTKSTKTSTSNTKKITKKTNCTNPYTSEPHYLGQGCNKLGQCTGYYCAPHSIHQCLKKLGITKFSENVLAKYCGTTTNGTSHDGINTCIAKVAKETKKQLKVTWKNFSDLGSTKKERYSEFGKLLCKSNTAILLHIGYQGSGYSANGKVFGHYECLDKVNTSTSMVRALNSLGNHCGTGYCGHLQERSFDLQSHYLANISQKSVCIIEVI